MSTHAISCPAYLDLRSVAPLIPDLNAGPALRAFRLGPETGGWFEVPLQFSPPLVASGTTRRAESASPPVALQDGSLIFDSVRGGRRSVSGDGVPCDAGRMLEIATDDASGSYFYVVRCDDLLDGRPSHPQAAANAVSYDSSSRTFRSDVFTFTHSRHNPLLFEAITLRSNAAGTSTIVAENARILLHADFRGLFDISIDSSRFFALRPDFRQGVHGIVHVSELWLNTPFSDLMFSESVPVGVWRDAIHMPVFGFSPVSPQKWFRRMSGLVYLWDYDPEAVTYNTVDMQLPVFDETLMSRATEDLIRDGLRFCSDDLCRFSLSGSSNGRDFAMVWTISRERVGRGFFPMYITALPRALGGTGSGSGLGRKTAGIYLEISGLNAGTHGFDFWVRVGPDDPLAAAHCPRQVQVLGLRERTDVGMMPVAAGYHHASGHPKSGFR